ncbi:MAG: hypothetical protein AB1778_08665 [Candidatus Bipolaricaulota bacterium]
MTIRRAAERQCSGGGPAAEALRLLSFAGLHRLACFAILSAAVLCGLGSLVAAGFDATLGLGGYVVPGRPAPLHVEGTPAERQAVSLQVLQVAGSPLEPQARKDVEIALAPAASASYRGVLLVHETVFPVVLRLMDADRVVVAEREVNLRARQRAVPFAVGVGRLPALLAESVVALDAADLPADWAAYAAAESVWIGVIPGGLGSASWDALARWVVAGGSLAVLGGEDLALLDAPRLRDLLPIARSPWTVDRSDAEGEGPQLREGASILAEREGKPWIFARRYGMGTVTLIDGDPDALTAGDAEVVRRLVPRAQTLSLETVTDEFLEAMALDRPSAVSAWSLLALCLGLTRWAARRRRAAAWLVTVSLALSAGALLYGLPHTVSDVYRADVRVSWLGPVGVSLACSSLQSATRAVCEVALPLGGTPYEISRLTGPPAPAAYEVAEGVVRFELASHERRLFAACADAGEELEATLNEDGTLRLASRLPEIWPAAWLVTEGRAYRLPAVKPGEDRVRVEDLPHVTAYPEYALNPALDRVLTVVAPLLAGEGNAWLVAGEVRSARSSPGTLTRVSSVHVIVAEVKRG